jgi:hypothetical protein
MRQPFQVAFEHATQLVLGFGNEDVLPAFIGCDDVGESRSGLFVCRPVGLLDTEDGSDLLVGISGRERDQDIETGRVERVLTLVEGVLIAQLPDLGKLFGENTKSRETLVRNCGKQIGSFCDSPLDRGDRRFSSTSTASITRILFVTGSTRTLRPSAQR